MENTMKILHIEKKGQMLDTYERFDIYEISRQNLELNDNYTETRNPIYNTIISTYQHTTPPTPVPPNYKQQNTNETSCKLSVNRVGHRTKTFTEYQTEKVNHAISQLVLYTHE
jgi:hypothetical protein